MMELKIDRTQWEKVKLGDVAFEYSKRINNPSESEFDRFVGSSNIDQWDFRVKSWESTDSVTSAMKLFEPNDYLLVRRSLYASDFRERAPRSHFHGVCSGDILTIKENPEKVVDGFLIGVFNSPALWNYVVANASGSITRRIKWRDLANYEFLLPPSDQQAQLAELLWAMDEVIEREREVLECLKKSYQVEIEKSVPRQYSDHWKLEELIKTRKGVTYKSDDYSDEENGIPLLNLKSIERGGGFNANGIKYYKGDYKEAHFVKNDDLIIACTDITRDGNVVGYPLHPSTYQKKRMLFTMDLVAIEISNKKLLRDYLYYALKSSWVHWILFAYSPGTTVLHLDLQGMKKIRIPKLSIGEQEEIVSKLRCFEDSIRNIESKTSDSQTLQKSLINQIF